MERSEIPHDPRHLWVPSGESKMMSVPMARSTQTVHLSCFKITPISKWNETTLKLEPRHLGQPLRTWFLSRWYIWSKPCTNLAPTLTLSPKRNKWDPSWPLSPRSSIRCIQNDFEPMTRSTQIVHLSYVKISTISKQNETSFHLSLVT
jgi:hypothetical protein